MTEALHAVEDYAFNMLQFKAIEAFTKENNQPAIHLLNKCKFKKTGTVDDPGYYHKRIYHMIIYQKIKRP